MNPQLSAPSERGKAQGKGYVLKNGKFVPADRTVGEIWDFLGRGKKLQDYVQYVHKASDGIHKIMSLYFDDKSQPEHPQWRSLVLDRVDNYSNCYGNGVLNYIGCLAGVISGRRFPTGKSRTK
ncbi:MAG: hypothetical protein AABX13_03785 [Nanoarchaeota archaeon]